jgi:GTPase SAR1 family protein
LAVQLDAEKQKTLAVRRQHPEVVTINYKIGIIGIRDCGKTVLARKISDFTYEGTTSEPTKVETYNRPVSTVKSDQGRRWVNHEFKITEWGGEYLVRANSDIVSAIQSELDQTQAQMVTNLVKQGEGTYAQIGYRALIFTVDLGTVPPGATGNVSPHVFSPERIHEQIEKYFGRQALQFFFDERITKHCDMIILFINKIDIVNYNEDVAIKHFERLIETFKELCKGQIEFKYLAGSAMSDNGTRKLFSMLVKRILSENEYDEHMNRTPQSGSSSGLFAEKTGKNAKISNDNNS